MAPDDDNMEPDGPGPDAPASDDTPAPATSPRPPHKPPVPESGHDANSMNRLMGAAARVMPKINTSTLNVDHPYGDGGYSEMPSTTMMRLGAGTQYGSK